ncbi:MAG: hypothetical protein HPY44_06000 [Armatimonadetes bacterium]|nr:hypothetical protein [Armatimonadota bacterium]
MALQVRAAYAFSLAVTLLASFGSALCQDAGPALPTITEVPGTNLSIAVMGGRPPSVMPPVPVTSAAGTPVLLQNVPSWTWCYGCANTAAAILFGYYDYKGYSKMFTGKENDGKCPLYNEEVWPDTMADPTYGESPLAASHKGVGGRTSKGHVDDWWSGANSSRDPCLDNIPPWTPHSPFDCTGDFMWTSRFDNVATGAGITEGNRDGVTVFYQFSDATPMTASYVRAMRNVFPNNYQHDGASGMLDFVEDKGYEAQELYVQLTTSDQFVDAFGRPQIQGFRFSDFCGEINAGRPVMLMCGEHVFVGYGYNTSGGQQTCYIRTTWDNDKGHTWTMNWMGRFAGLQMWQAVVVKLKAPPPDAKPDALIQGPAGGGFVGTKEYGEDGSGQTAYGPAMPGATSVYIVRVLNRGATQDTFFAFGSAGNSRWRVRYYDALTGGNDITADATAQGGASLGLIKPEEYKDLRVEVTPLSSATANSKIETLVKVWPSQLLTRIDAVKAVTLLASADVNHDGKIDQKDQALFVGSWKTCQQGGATNANCDLDGNGTIDPNDAMRFLDLLLIGK